MQVAGKKILITGANRGIGLEICRQLARAGLTVVLTSRSAAKGRTAVRALREEGLEVDHHLLDVTSPVGIKALAAYLAKRYDRVDVLVNNAGVLLDPKASRVADSRSDATAFKQRHLAGGQFTARDLTYRRADFSRPEGWLW